MVSNEQHLKYFVVKVLVHIEINLECCLTIRKHMSPLGMIINIRKEKNA